MKRTIFIGQAMPRKKNDLHDWPSLNSWLYSINLTHEQIVANCYYSALVDYFPGVKGSSHRVPSHEEIVEEQDRLKNTILTFGPEIVVPIGRQSIAYCLGEKVGPLTGYIGRSFEVDPFGLLDKKMPVIPLPHPSGASTWYHKSEHKELLKKALRVLRISLG